MKDHNPQGMDYTQIQQHLPTMAEQDWCGEYEREAPRDTTAG